MDPEDRSFSTARANVTTVAVALPVLAATAVAFGSIHGWEETIRVFRHVSLTAAVLVIFAGVVAHELLHLVGWRLAAGLPRGTVRLGFRWRTITPFAHCSVPMRLGAYRIGAALPGAVLGIVPLIVGAVAGHPLWFFFGLLFTFAAGGDALTLWILRDVRANRLIQDHPTRIGCLILPDSVKET